jgi:hypothetical protein
MVRLTLILSLLVAALNAQPLRVFSEFVRFGADGEPSVPLTPREILSPAMARNAFTTFQILVKGATGETSSLWIGQNPENSFQVTLYREKAGRLTKVSQPVDIDGTEVVWMDVWVSRDTPAARMKLEPELYVHQDWVIYPMEVRVAEATVPDESHPYGVASAMDVMRTLTCGTKLDLTRTPRDAGEPATPASLTFRNALADLALAQRAPNEDVQRIFGPCNQAAPENPESYLRIRDYLLRLR